MNYWLTTHWPPRRDEAADTIAPGIWIQSKQKLAGKELRVNDLVLIYQSRSGKSEIVPELDGVRIVRRHQGKEGIVAIAKVCAQLYDEKPKSESNHYSDGSSKWWRWRAPLEILSRSGFVPRPKINKVFQYKSNYNYRGFGDLHSGLKRITKDQYYALSDMFRGQQSDIELPKKRISNFPRTGIGTGIESVEHRQLKEYVAADPSTVLGEYGLRTLAVEYEFATEDKADIALWDHAGRAIGVEVEVAVGNGQTVGILQAIKYRYMLELCTKRALGDSRALLVAYSISPAMQKLCNKYSVEYREFERKTVLEWAESL